MERIKLYRIVAVLVAALSLCACSLTPRASDYRAFGFRGEIGFENEGVRVTALAEVAPPAEGEAREITLTVTAPSSLAGLVMRGTDEEGTPVRAEFGETVLEETMLGALWGVTELLVPKGVFRSVCVTEENGAELIYAEIVRAKEEREAKRYELYLGSENGEVRRIRCGERQVELHSFEFLR